MSHRIRRRRWHPPGKGWIVTWDAGRLAVWMRPEPQGGVTIAMYLADYFGDNTAEVWIVRVPRGSWIPGEVMDKPHRIRWVLKVGADSCFHGEVLEHRLVVPSHANHRRNGKRRRIYKWPLPRPIRNSLAEQGLTIRLAIIRQIFGHA